MLLRPADENDDIQAQFLQQLYEHLPELRAIIEPFQHFVAMVREKRVEAFNVWLQAASRSPCRALKQFALGLQWDADAVRAALSLDWSNGQTEGQINRLKFIKRQMYGRAKFDLLRLRILHSPSWHEICG